MGLGPWGATRAEMVARFEEITKMGALLANSQPQKRTLSRFPTRNPPGVEKPFDFDRPATQILKNRLFCSKTDF